MSRDLIGPKDPDGPFKDESGEYKDHSDNALTSTLTRDMDILPTELWNHICTFLRPSDLAAVALASSSYLSAARYQLYTSVVLRSDSPFGIYTFRLLKTSTALARRVQSLALETDAKWPHIYTRYGNSWIDTGIFNHMERLRALQIKRLPCVVGDDGKADEFVAILIKAYEKCKSLSEITIFLFVTRPKLHRIVYNCRYSSGVNWTFLIRVLCSAPSAITYLDLFIGNCANHFSVMALLFFPALHTLLLRSAPQIGMVAIALFLVAHPSIRHLSLIDMDHHLPIDKLQIDMLPQLQTIHAPPFLLLQLSMRCESLRHIHALVLEHTDMMMHNFVENIVMLVRSVGGFPGLVHCSVPGIISSARTAEVVRIIAAESTQLTCWTGGFYYRHVKQLRILVDALASFPALARLDICEWTYPTSPPTPEQLDGLTYIARKCPSLQKMSLYMTHLPTSEILTVYRVVGRTAASGSHAQLKETYRCIEGGPYIKERRRVDYRSVDWEDEIALDDLGW